MALAKAYLDLKNTDKQREELRHLFQSLSFSHFRDARDMFQRLHLTYDIFGKLPTELSENVAVHLPLYQCYQARRVSKRWKEVLSSDHLIKQILASQSLDPQHPSGTLPNNIHLNLLSQNLDAYLGCYPFSVMNQDIPYNGTIRYAYHVAYADGNLVWINAGNRRSLEMLNLVSGIRDTLTSPNRARLAALAVSSTIAVALDMSAKCHIWILSAPRNVCHRALQLDSSLCRGIAVSSSSLVLYRETGGQGISTVQFTTWELADVTTKEFTHTFDCEILTRARCGLTRDGRSLEILAHVISQPCDCEMRYIRSDLAGHIEAQASRRCPWPHLPSESVARGLGRPFDPFMLDSFPVPSINSQGATVWRLFRVSYDTTQKQLKVKSIILHGTAPWTAHLRAMQVSKEIARHMSEDDFGSRLFPASELRRGAGSVPSHLSKYLNQFHLSTPRRAGELDELALLMGDERFLVANTREGVTVWCFDKQITMPNEDIQYRERRQQEVKARVNECRIKEDLLKGINSSNDGEEDKQGSISIAHEE